MWNCRQQSQQAQLSYMPNMPSPEEDAYKNRPMLYGVPPIARIKHSKLESMLSFKVRHNPYIVAQMKASNNPTQQPAPPLREVMPPPMKSRFNFFSSLKKTGRQSPWMSPAPVPVLPPKIEDSLVRYLKSNGSLAHSFITYKDVTAHCDTWLFKTLHSNYWTRNWIQRGQEPQQWCCRLGVSVRKLDLLHSCFSLNFYFLMFFSQFPSMFLLLTYSQSLFLLFDHHPRHSRWRRSQILILLIQDKVQKSFYNLRIFLDSQTNHWIQW